MTRNVRVRVPLPPGVTLIPEFITEQEEEVKKEAVGQEEELGQEEGA